MAKPTQRSWTMLKHLTLYLLGARSYALQLRIKHEGIWHTPMIDDCLVLEMFSDADWSADKKTRRSVSAGLIFFRGCLLLVSSRSQRVVALSSAESELHAAVSVACDGILLKVCLQFCLSCTVKLKLLLDNIAAKQVMLRAGVGRVRHLSCRVLWIQDYVKQKQLTLASVPSKHNCSDIGTKRLTCERMKFLMNMIGVFDMDSEELVGASQMRREQEQNDTKAALRLVRDSLGENSNHSAVKSSKAVLRMLTMALMMITADALSLHNNQSPMICLFNNEWFKGGVLLTAMVTVAIFSWLCFMNHQDEGDEVEPEPLPRDEVREEAATLAYDEIKIYTFLSKCIAKADDLTKSLDDVSAVADATLTYRALTRLFNEFETDGPNRERVDQMLFLHEAIQRHDPNFSARVSGGISSEVTEPDIGLGFRV